MLSDDIHQELLEINYSLNKENDTVESKHGNVPQSSSSKVCLNSKFSRKNVPGNRNISR